MVQTHSHSCCISWLTSMMLKLVQSESSTSMMARSTNLLVQDRQLTRLLYYIIASTFNMNGWVVLSAVLHMHGTD